MFLVRYLFLIVLLMVTLGALPQSTSHEIIFNSENTPERNLFYNLQIYKGQNYERAPFNDIKNIYSNQFIPLNQAGPEKEYNVRWLRFSIINNSETFLDYKVSIIFTDKITVYCPNGKGGYNVQNTGDLIPVNKRNPEIGQMVFANLSVYPSSKNIYYIKLESNTNISKQFKALTLKSIMIYSEKRFEKLFISSRVYQAGFYGAILVIFLYNLFIFISLRNRFSLLYLLFICTFVVFLASNNGFFAETFLNNYPRFDLYIRFLSTPLLLLFYTLFSKSYLKLSEISPRINSILNIWMGLLGMIIIIMISGQWAVGRTVVTFSGIINFVVVGLLALYSLKKGFVPAKFFLAANSLFIISGILFALQRINFVVYDPLNQYQAQASAVLQIALLSLGIAERIQLVRKELIEKTVENERLERQRELELKILVEDKNQALQNVVDELDMFIYKIGHDIRGPIARIMGLSKVALMDIKDKGALNYFQLLDKESLSLSDTLARLSMVYEINHLTVRKVKINLREALEKIINEVINSFNCSDIIFKINFTESEFITDKYVFDLILKNLIENAVKFRKNTCESFIEVNIETIDNDFLISVVDNGIGISPQNNKLIFDMFSRAAGIHHGVGLGLYMSKLAAAKLGGDIKLVPGPQGFTRFSVILPK